MKEIRIGRHPDNDVILSDNTVSKFHAILLIEGDTYIINDLNSRNGIFINGTRIKGSAQLDTLDIVKLGTALFAWKNHINTKEKIFPKIENERNESPIIQNSVPKSSNNRNIIPAVIAALVIFFLGVVYFIVESNKIDRNSDPPIILNPKPKEEPVREPKVEPAKPEPEPESEPAPKPQIINLMHAFYGCLDNRNATYYYANVEPRYEGKYTFEFETDESERQTFTYYETSRNEGLNLLTLYSTDARESIVVQITGHKSFKIIDGNSWIYLKNRTYSEYVDY